MIKWPSLEVLVTTMQESTTVKSAPRCDHVFEFSDNVAVMRYIRAFLYLQIVGVIIDNTYVELPVLFRTFCRDPLFYVIRFYSRPFIDATYIFDYYRSQIIRGATSVFTHGRSLSSNGRILSYTSRWDKGSHIMCWYDSNVLLHVLLWEEKKRSPLLLHLTLLYFTYLYFTLLYFTLLYFTLLYFTLLFCCSQQQLCWE